MSVASGLDRIVPATSERWDDLVTLFGPSGAYSGCWCLWWRLTSREFDAASNHERRDQLRELVDTGREPGLLGYRGDDPVGWVSVAPRTEFGRALRSPLFSPGRAADDGDPDEVRGPADDDRVWSVVCFYVAREHRGGQLMVELLRGAVDHARDRGARAVEGYAVDKVGAPSADLFPGVPSVYLAAGFREVARPSATRRIMRIEL